MRMRKKELRVFHFNSNNLVNCIEDKYFDHMGFVLKEIFQLYKIGIINTILTNHGVFHVPESAKERLSADIYRGEWRR